MNNKLVTRLLCASAIAVALTAPSRAQGVISTHRLSAALAAEAVTEAVAACAKQGYHIAATIIDTDGVEQAALRGDARNSPSFANTPSNSRSSPAFRTWTSTPSVRADRSTSLSWGSATAGLFGLTSRATTRPAGITSCSSSSPFAPITSIANEAAPVTLPLGRLRLVTRPRLIGSPAVSNTIGIVEVAALAASAAGVLVAAITAT